MFFKTILSTISHLSLQHGNSVPCLLQSQAPQKKIIVMKTFNGWLSRWVQSIIRPLQKVLGGFLASPVATSWKSRISFVWGASPKITLKYFIRCPIHLFFYFSLFFFSCRTGLELEGGGSYLPASACAGSWGSTPRAPISALWPVSLDDGICNFLGEWSLSSWKCLGFFSLGLKKPGLFLLFRVCS